MICKRMMLLKNGPYLFRLSSTGSHFIIPPSQPFQHVWAGFCRNCLRGAATTAVPKEDAGSSDSGPFDGKTKKEMKPTVKKAPNIAKPNSKAKALSQSAKLILEYVQKHCGSRFRDYARLLPKQSLGSTSVIPTSLYLINEKEAKNISSAIKLDNPDKDSPVLELNPGLGLLTWELLKEIGFKHVTCLEDCGPLAENLLNQFDLSVIDCGLDDLPRHHHLDKHDGGERINSILTSITTDEDFESKRTNESKRKLYIVGAIPHVSTINFLIRSYVTKRVFFEDDLPWSEVTMYAVLGAKAVHVCTATPDSGLVTYRPTSVFFQTLFKHKEMGTVPSTAFIPWQIEDVEFLSGTKKRRLKVKDPSNLKLMRIEVNHEAVEKIGKNNLFVYWYFVRQHLYARTNRIIPELERWIPGCGVQLIRKGFTIYSQFGMLSPDQVLELYLYFVSLPQFANSSFLNAVEKFQTRLELSEEEEGENESK